uniref:Cobyrinate a,c-diamide synthase n=1 Tax=Candidatus Kentrum eta TaxID=2126337 RepID=A0A450VM93_9GAMM|nr:MAG: hydrogenobyrinic acid a,c-diamide synthase (glutamine-hydrolysing) /cobyrinate a,c-diamide synthase [Candidatus Kentron sp. H]VFK03214.1 MAG: hydrogenobyrinic acid a,c-diamide synthase (glutamine-hydrolysing) /cobyrinate a,c-diamide synthase [Candidatus Kentron sp. H]VFK05919.1 MAG: hydrogenobyrinic acid a,c-diamide synthase (glutamine-hydrolysing) /cobyrinate a,c-diamide synthase [Candidatus Kentron sp. H]
MTDMKPLSPSEPAAPIPRLYLSAAHKSSGKTTVTVGLCAALRARGVHVRPFKKGPDYIDPLWLALAAGRACHNLDFHTMNRAEIREVFLRESARSSAIPGDVIRGDAGGGVSLIEGNKGLYDGLDLEGSNSNAALAQLLDAPVVLVIDTRGMTRGIAPLLLGYMGFEPKVGIAGVLLNHVGGARHEGKLRAVIEHYTNLPVLGAIPHDTALQVPERHLGLVPGNEFGDPEGFIARAAGTMAEHVALDRLLAIARAAPPLPGEPPTAPPTDPLPPRVVAGREAGEPEPSDEDPAPTVTLAIARDSAFGFYYPGDLTALGRAGAELVFFDTLSDAALPPADALFIGGGFPEVHMAALEANVALRRSIRAALAGGMPAYAECGGLMYLTRGIAWRGARREMVGAIPAETTMHPRPQGKGYVLLRETGDAPWGLSGPEGEPAEIPAHEFHHASVAPSAGDEGLRFAYEVLRGHGIDGRRDGIVHGNLLAGFSHLRDVAGNPWAARFVGYIRRVMGRAP